jgi:hypothetical protein
LHRVGGRQDVDQASGHYQDVASEADGVEAARVQRASST